MTTTDLVRMANQIAHFFAPYPELDAVAGVREHLELFWTREMRQELRGLVSPGHDDAARDLEPLVRHAIASWPAPPSA
jgi:formate dehydrogenase subunit delta